MSRNASVQRLEEALMDTMSPEGITATAAWLREKIDSLPGHLVDDPDAEQSKIVTETAWLAGVLESLVPVEERQRIMDEHCI